MGRLSHPPRLKGKVQRRPLGHSPKGRGLSRGRADQWDVRSGLQSWTRRLRVQGPRHGADRVGHVGQRTGAGVWPE